MSIIQGSDLEVLVKAESSGVGVTGLLFSDFTVNAWWPGKTSLELISLVDGDVVEIGNGLYAIKLSEVTEVLGELFLQFSGGSFDNVEKTLTVIPAPISTLANPELCIISGNIVDIGGNPGKGQHIRFRRASVPSEQNGSIIASDAVDTVPDAFGNFSVALVRNQTVIVEITNTGIRVQVVIPDQASATLLSILPPFG